MNQTVNKQLLDALKGLCSINDETITQHQRAVKWLKAHEAIAAAEQAQQAEQVGDGESIDFPIAFLTTESGGGKYKLVLSFASLPDLHKGHDRILSAIKHSQPPTQQQAEPVAYLKTAAGVMQLSFEGNPVVNVGADVEVQADMVEPLYAQPPAVAVAVCNWNQEDDGGSWVSDCGQYFTLDDGDPSENGMKFCHGCGKRLAEHPWQDEGEEADESAMPSAAQKGGAPC